MARPFKNPEKEKKVIEMHAAGIPIKIISLEMPAAGVVGVINNRFYKMRNRAIALEAKKSGNPVSMDYKNRQ